MFTNNIIRITLRSFTAIAIFSLAACSSNENKKPEAEPGPIITVSVSTPSGFEQQGVNISGQIESSQSVNISTRIMGYVTQLNVKVGDHVTKGQLLASISNQDILAKKSQTDAMITEAQATVNSAQKDYDRFTILYKQQSATVKELDNVELQFNSAKARLEAARQMRNEVNASLGYSSLRAPFSGVVTQKLIEVGSMANPGMTLLTIEQTGSFQVSASVPENLISKIQIGAEAIVNVRSIDKSIRGVITQINPSSQFSGGQFIIKVSIPDKDEKGLYAGMYSNISIPLKTKGEIEHNDNSVMVPLSIIERKDQLTGLYTISTNNTALLRWVRLGKTFGDKVEVITGLERNERFVLQADGKLYNGVAVKVK